MNNYIDSSSSEKRISALNAAGSISEVANSCTIENNSLKYFKYVGYNLTSNFINGLQIKKIIFNGPATTVFFKDNTKVTVKCSENDTYSEFDAVNAAIVKKIFGSCISIKKIINGKNTIKKSNPKKGEKTIIVIEDKK